MADSTTRTQRGSTRRKMLISAAEVMRERGAAGVTIDAVLSRSGAPRGSVYHHFPGGRTQLITEALQFAGDSIAARIDHSSDGALPLLRQFFAFWEHVLADSGFTAGCPVVAAATAGADDDPPLTAVAGRIFGRWRDALAKAFAGDGFDHSEAASLAVMCIASLEGAVVLCRATGNAAALRDVASQLEFLIKAREFVRRTGLSGSAGH